MEYDVIDLEIDSDVEVLKHLHVSFASVEFLELAYGEEGDIDFV